MMEDVHEHGVPVPPPPPHCAVCGLGGKTLKRCTKCRAVLYCSRNCQITDWTSHRNLCIAAKKENPEDIGTLTSRIKELDVETVNKTIKITAIQSRGCSADQDEESGVNNKNNIPSKNDVKITVKCLKERHKLLINPKLAGSDIWKYIASSVHIPMDKLKLVSKGKLVTADTIGEHVRNKAVFQAIGEVAENEEGLVSGHVDCIMARLGVERNQAVRALKETGDIVDAILLLGNK